MDPKQITEYVVTIIASGGLAVIMTALWQRKKIFAEANKTGVDAAQVLTAASVALLEPMKSQLESMNVHLQRAELRAEELDNKLVITRRELEECKTLVANMHRQLAFYRDRYGAPPRQIES